MLQPWSRMDRLSPAFCLTFVPGSSTLPLALADIFLTCNFPILTTPWFLAICVECLCKKSLRAFAACLCRRLILALCFLQFDENFVFRASIRCAFASLFEIDLKALSGWIFELDARPPPTSSRTRPRCGERGPWEGS